MSHREFADYIVDLLRPLGPVAARRMFGGFGLYLDGLMFALIADDSVYLKADAGNRALFIGRGMPRFEYVRQGKPVALSYHALPADALEDADDLLALCRSAFEAALRGRKVPGNASQRS